MQKKAIFITGFNNWGKTTIIEKLFNGRKRYYRKKTYAISDLNITDDFFVETHSNDDFWGKSWIDLLNFRTEFKKESHLLTALCPTMHPSNNFLELLSNNFFDDFNKLYIFLIKNKWEHHAMLNIKNVLKSAENFPKIEFVIIDADENILLPNERLTKNIEQIKNEIVKIFN